MRYAKYMRNRKKPLICFPHKSRFAKTIIDRKVFDWNFRFRFFGIVKQLLIESFFQKLDKVWNLRRTQKIQYYAAEFSKSIPFIHSFESTESKPYPELGKVFLFLESRRSISKTVLHQTTKEKKPPFRFRIFRVDF